MNKVNTDILWIIYHSYAKARKHSIVVKERQELWEEVLKLRPVCCMHFTFSEWDLTKINILELFENSLPPGNALIPTGAKMGKITNKAFNFLELEPYTGR